MQNHPFLKGPADSSSGRKNHQTLGSLEVSQKNCPRKLDIIWSRNVKFHRSLEFDKGGVGVKGGQGVTRAHTLESQAHTGTILHHFFHPESPAHTDWSHVRTQPFSRVTRAHRLESQVHTTTIFASFFPPRVTRDRVGWGGVGMMTLFCTCTHVQSAAQWTASVHTLHMSKPVM